MLATLLLLPGCASSSAPPPLIQTQTIKVLPPPGLLADIAPPAITDQIQTRDDANDVMLAMAGWGAQLRQRLADLRDWAAQSSSPVP